MTIEETAQALAILVRAEGATLALGGWGTAITTMLGAGLFAFLVEVVKTVSASRKEKRELASKAVHAPQVAESLLLGNTEKAVAVQASVIEGLRVTVSWQADKLLEMAEANSAKDAKITLLQTQVLEIAVLRQQVQMLSVELAALRLRLPGGGMDPDDQPPPLTKV